MNCPGACLVYASERHSYRELPLRFAEFGLCTRNEREGVLHGLLRVRAFTQDDAPRVLHRGADRARGACDHRGDRRAVLLVRIRRRAGRAVDAAEKSIGTAEQWEDGGARAREALDEMGREYQVNPGDGAFYGPKIDFHITDALGRRWQCGTCQLDFFMPERFGLTYTGSDDTQRTAGDDPSRAARLDRALPRDPDRALRRRVPGWLAPVQAKVLPIADRHTDYASAWSGSCAMRASGPRSMRDRSRWGARSATPNCAKVPYMLVVGDKEQDGAGVSVRRHGQGDLGLMPVGEAADRIGSESR